MNSQQKLWPNRVASAAVARRWAYAAHAYGGTVPREDGAMAIACPRCRQLLDWEQWFGSCPGLASDAIKKGDRA